MEFDSKHLSSISILVSPFTLNCVFAFGRALILTLSFITIIPPIS